MAENRYKWIKAKYESRCAECGNDILERDTVLYDPEEQEVFCETCGKDIMEKRKGE